MNYTSWCPKVMLVLICLISFYIMFTMYIVQVNIQEVRKKNDHFSVDTEICKIPRLDPFADEVRKYIEKPKLIDCGSNPPLVNVNGTSLSVNQEALSSYNITKTDIFDCWYQPFWRVDPKSGNSDNNVKFGHKTIFKNDVAVSEEFVKVECAKANQSLYTDYFSFVPLKKAVQNRRDNLLNVLIIGIDAVSQTNLHRQLPKTVRWLTEEMNATEMMGYNKVGDNTFPNLIPVLTGFSVEELRNNCWPSNEAFFDNCTFMWDKYEERGYLTSYAEDASWMGVFNYVKHGFQKQPTDYYWRTFNYEAESVIGHRKPMNAKLCLGSRLVYKTLLDYVLRFVNSLYLKPHFGFFWGASLSHDYLNLPALADEDYVDFFKTLSQSKPFEHTAVIFMSDHGIRWGGIRSTHQGYLEERLPFLFLVLPQWFQKKYPAASSNLKSNSRLLTTPFDLHETLLDLLNTASLKSENLEKRVKSSQINRGISLFQPIPEERTCKMAGISSHWCTCMESVVVSTKIATVQNVAKYLVSYINAKLSNYSQCSNLTLSTINSARLSKHEDAKKKLSVTYYTLTFVAIPGEAKYEATALLGKNQSFKVVGTISRLNLYGNSSYCMPDFQLKLYCYCCSQ